MRRKNLLTTSYAKVPPVSYSRKIQFIGYEHCSTILIRKVKKYAIAEIIFS